LSLAPPTQPTLIIQNPTHVHLADQVLTKTLLKAEDFLKR
jgi:hypothetical protein